MTTATLEKYHLDYDEAVELLDRAVAEKGEDYVYKANPDHGMCMYMHGNEPGCIVGHVLIYKGVDPELIRRHEGQGVTVLTDVSGWLDLDFRTERLLGNAQSLQDQGNTWGASVARAKELSAAL